MLLQGFEPKHFLFPLDNVLFSIRTWKPKLKYVLVDILKKFFLISFLFLKVFAKSIQLILNFPQRNKKYFNLFTIYV